MNSHYGLTLYGLRLYGLRISRIIGLAESEGGVQRHDVILMHNQPIGNPAIVAALPVIIRYFQRHDYHFVKLQGRLDAPERNPADLWLITQEVTL